MRQLIRFALAFLALVGGAFIAARLAVPNYIPAEEVDRAIAAAAVAIVSDASPRNRLRYLSIDLRDPDPGPLAAVRREASLEIKPMSQRIDANDHCTPKEGMVIVGACKKDDFLELQYIAMPLWGVTLLHANTAACGAEVVMVKLPGAWKVASQRWVCS